MCHGIPTCNTGERLTADDLLATIRRIRRARGVVAREDIVLAERLIKPGWYVQAGQRMATTEPAGEGDEQGETVARVYVPAGPGKRVSAGMEMHLSRPSRPPSSTGRSSAR